MNMSNFPENLRFKVQYMKIATAAKFEGFYHLVLKIAKI